MRSIFFESADNNSSPDNDRGYGLLSAVKAIEFPNLDASDGTFILNKMFLAKDNIFPQTVFVHYSTDGIEYTEKQLDFDGNLKYSLKLPYLFNDELVDFYFTYDDNSGATLRDPISNNYKFYYGSLEISLNTDLKRTYNDYIVSEPYPNPFYPLQSTFHVYFN